MNSRAKPVAAGTVVFHAHRGFGVLTAVNLMTGWVSARFGDECRSLELSLCCDSLCHADGEPIRFRRAAPDYMPHARLMGMVRELHRAGYERLYLYAWPKPSGLHWRWHLFAGHRDWVHRPLRAGWHGSGSAYIFDPVFGWGDSPGSSASELAAALASFDPEGLAHARGRDALHTLWFARACDALLPNYAFSLGWDTRTQWRSMPHSVPVMSVRRGVAPFAGPALPWPPGFSDGWAFRAGARVLRAFSG